MKKLMPAAFVAASVAAIGMVGVAAPAQAASCTVAAAEYSGSGYTRTWEINGTNCDRVGARTYTYFGGGYTESTTVTHLYDARAYKKSGGSYSGGAYNYQINGVWVYSSYRAI